MSSKIAYIIPAHKVDHRLLYAVESVLGQVEGEKVRCIVACTPDVAEMGIPESIKPHLDVVVVEDDDTSMPALVNAGLTFARTQDDIEWFSILEMDDKLLPQATKRFLGYSRVFPDYSAFAGLSLICEPNGSRTPEEEKQTPQLKTMANEAAWAASIMENVGVFDFNAMLRMNFMLLTACYFKLELLEEIGMLKSNMKYFYDYEFLLRVVYNGYDVRAIPKATHYHFTNGEAMTQHRELDRGEAEFWQNAARKEYFFEFDRELAYEPTEETETTEA